MYACGPDLAEHRASLFFDRPLEVSAPSSYWSDDSDDDDDDDDDDNNDGDGGDTSSFSPIDDKQGTNGNTLRHGQGTSSALHKKDVRISCIRRVVVSARATTLVFSDLGKRARTAVS